MTSPCSTRFPIRAPHHPTGSESMAGRGGANIMTKTKILRSTIIHPPEECVLVRARAGERADSISARC